MAGTTPQEQQEGGGLDTKNMNGIGMRGKTRTVGRGAGVKG
jgi:hypothetical protein